MATYKKTPSDVLSALSGEWTCYRGMWITPLLRAEELITPNPTLSYSHQKANTGFWPVTVLPPLSPEENTIACAAIFSTSHSQIPIHRFNVHRHWIPLNKPNSSSYYYGELLWPHLLPRPRSFCRVTHLGRQEWGGMRSHVFVTGLAQTGMTFLFRDSLSSSSVQLLQTTTYVTPIYIWSLELHWTLFFLLTEHWFKACFCWCEVWLPRAETIFLPSYELIVILSALTLTQAWDFWTSVSFIFQNI